MIENFLGRPSDFMIVINKDNEHILSTNKSDEYMKRLAEMKRRAKIMASKAR